MEWGVSIPVQTSPGYKGLEPIVNWKTQTETVASKGPNSKGRFFQTTQSGWVGHFCGSRHPTALSRCPKHQVASGLPGHPGPCPHLSLPGPDPVLRTSKLFLCAPHPAPAPGSRRSQSARALRVTSPGLGINCQVTRRRFHSFWLIRAGMSIAKGARAPRAGSSWGPAARLPGVEAATFRR